MRRLMRHRGTALALLVALVGVSVAQRRLDDPHIKHDRWDLPAFDAYVYVAMAEQPAFFTAAPWGYRVLAPWLVSLLPGTNAVRGFRDMNLYGLSLSGLLLFLFLRRLGHGEWPSLLAVAAFVFSPPVAELLRYPFLVEPVTIALEIAFLYALTAGAGPALLALLVLLGALSKELALMLVPLVFFVRGGAGRWRRGAVETAVVALPAAIATAFLRHGWQPQSSSGSLALGGDTFALVFERLLASWDETWPAALLGGLMPLALLGALRGNARPFLARYGYLLAVTLALPLVAWVNIGGPRPMAFFGPNTLRLLLFALPALFPLALLAIDRVWPHMGPEAPPPTRPRWTEAAAAVAVVAALAATLLGLDRYRRVDLRGFRDGPLVLALSRESLRTANRIETGKPVVWDPAERTYVWGVTHPHEMEKMRWFLREGWGERPHYGAGPVVMKEDQASLLVPLYVPRDLEVTLRLEAPAPVPLTVTANGRPAGILHVTPAGEEATVRLPASALFRGDNELRLAAPGGAEPRVRLHHVAIARARP